MTDAGAGPTSVPSHATGLVEAHLAELRAGLSALKGQRQPNRPIDGYDKNLAELSSDWLDRLDAVGPDQRTALLDEIVVATNPPVLADDDPDKEHLQLHYQLWRISESAKKIIHELREESSAGEAGLIRPEDFRSEFEAVRSSLADLERQVVAIQREVKRPITDGISLQFGPISISADAIRKAVSRARALFDPRDPVDAGALSRSLSEISTTTADGVRQVSNPDNHATREIVSMFRAFASSAAAAVRTGMSMLRKAYTGSSLPDVETAPATSAILAGATRTPMAIDLGTASTRIYLAGIGLVLDEPSVVALRKAGGRRTLEAVGRKAQDLVRTDSDHIELSRPIREGVIADYEVAEGMLRAFMGSLRDNGKVVKADVIATARLSATSVHRRATNDVCLNSIARRVGLVDTPMASAVGAGLSVHEPTGSAIIDIGAGTTEVAVLMLSGMVVWGAERVGGDHLDEALIAYLRRQYDLDIPRRRAEEIRRAVGVSGSEERFKALGATFGEDVRRRTKRSIQLTADDIRMAYRVPLSEMIETVRKVAGDCPPEIKEDLETRGFAFVGGLSLMEGMAQELRDAIGIPITVAANPLTASVRGLGEMVDKAKWREGIIKAS